MKKSISSVIVLILCVACIGFSACNAQENYQPPNAVYNDREGSFYNYLVSTEFSFGKMSWVDMADYLNNDVYEGESELIFSNNEARNNTLDIVQKYCLKHKDYLIESLEHVAFKFDQNKDDVKVSTSVFHDYHTDMARMDVFSGYEIGDFVVEPVSNTSIRQDRVHEVYKYDKYYFVFASGDRNVKNWSDPHYCRGALNFDTLIYGENWKRVIVLRTKVDFPYAHMIDKMFDVATIEERHEIAQYYQAIHKEICTSFYYSESGQKYLNFYSNPIGQ